MHTSDFGSSLNSKFYLRAATSDISCKPFAVYDDNADNELFLQNG